MPISNSRCLGCWMEHSCLWWMIDDPNRCCLRDEGVNCWLENKWPPPPPRWRRWSRAATAARAPPCSLPAGRTSPSCLRLRSCSERSYRNCQLRCIRPRLYQRAGNQDPPAPTSRRPAAAHPDFLFLRRGRQTKDPVRSNFGSFRSTSVCQQRSWRATISKTREVSKSTLRIVGRRLIVTGDNFANAASLFSGREDKKYTHRLS